MLNDILGAGFDSIEESNPFNEEKQKEEKQKILDYFEKILIYLIMYRNDFNIIYKGGKLPIELIELIKEMRDELDEFKEI